MHATDFSPASQKAFTTAIDIAGRSGGRLLLLHVVTPPAMALEDSFVTARTWQDMERAAVREAEGRLGRLVARARKAGVRAEAAVAEGVAYEQIVRTARRRRADLIVIGTHGRTGLGRIVLGSVAERVVGRASCPVLTVRGGGLR